MRASSYLVAISAVLAQAASATASVNFLKHVAIASGGDGEQSYVAEFKREAASTIEGRWDPSVKILSRTDDADIKDYRFLNKKTRKFVVNGKRLPDVKFDVGESYAGLLPISDDPHEERKLFFWFFPAQDPNHGKKDITLWLNGGPGCSSLGGFLTENGPFLWQDGTPGPYPNPYSWNKLTNMIWVEQPVGVGFSQGKPNITNEHELAQEFAGFWKNFMTTFDMQGADVYLTGESYAGMYVPYIANHFIKQDDDKLFNLKGVSINDPLLGDQWLQFVLPVMPFFNYWQNLFGLDEGILAKGNAAFQSLGYDKYFDDYFQFPPPQKPFPPPAHSEEFFSDVFRAAKSANPCWNIYMVAQQCPTPLSARGDPTGKPSSVPVYFGRRDVQRHINAPPTDWSICVDNVFLGDGDTSDSPFIDNDNTLVSVIEHLNNTIIGSGALDGILPTNGTLFTIQNATWHGKQGFDAFMPNKFFVPPHKITSNITISSHMGNIGRWVKRDGFTFYEIHNAGHEVPGWSLSGGYRMLQVLLGKVTDLGSSQPVF